MSIFDEFVKQFLASFERLHGRKPTDKERDRLLGMAKWKNEQQKTAEMQVVTLLVEELKVLRNRYAGAETCEWLVELDAIIDRWEPHTT